MRKSQAPSLKVKSPLELINKKDDLWIPNNTPENSFRSTESVLDLLSSSNNSFNDQKTPRGTDRDLKILNEHGGFEEQKVVTEINSNKEVNINTETLVVYNVVYGKQSKKKHKTWEGDGTIEVGSKYIKLKDEEGKLLGVGPYPKVRKLEEGVRVYIGNKEVELLDIAETKASTTKSNIESQTVCNKNDTVLKPVLNFGKKFLSPKINYSSGVVLPEPNAEHQWFFNQNGLPLSPVYIERSLSIKLREHQCAGVSFLYECIMGFKDHTLNGAILADEMGLGKTLQCIALIWTLLKQGPYGNKPVVRKVLIVTPSSLVMNWYNEFIKWLGRIKLNPYCVDQKNKPAKMNGPVMIISYEMLLRWFEDVEKHDFDLLICDEGHRLKNSNIRTTQLLQRLHCCKRILLTGTPIQNDLQEFYSLVDFVNPNVLGSPSEFRKRFMEPILASRQPNADEEVLARGRECAQDLKKITSKFLLRRTRDVLSNFLPPRHEIVVFCKMTNTQIQLYNSLIDNFIDLKENIFGLNENFSPLELIIALKKICNHPFLLKKENHQKISHFVKNALECTVSADKSSKVKILVNILNELKETSPKEKVVVVSNSTQTLDLLEKILDSNGYSSCRLDGSTPTAQRNNIVERFNLSYNKGSVFLLSAKAGGVGLNLTGASRLVLFDPDWNPATDLQAIGRVWRDGQKFPVYLYRLLTTGTIEEKIYQRQISKQGLCEGTIDPENAKSIKLSKEELKDLFSSCSLEDDCLTHNTLSCNCTKRGEIPIPEVEEEERKCQLLKKSSSSLKISDLFHWEHHGCPFNENFLSSLCLEKSEREISFIFRNCKN